ncbi:hypothetical protein SSOG_08966 [Streptomyces himastatinicus ATCC 53653]|uniref:SDR family oxidoreductase n=1 Tax=Streptomyces himastatinicus ATCC 53653 TaxID=457427 RepID=D9WKX7_9ACTN|nr:SDR family oxidoreductase [Streptomyces himastatinicus]EFL29252.1 hypothetical protein SSOG_08966 [Streptomyces himastatinicus ATCC 53653]
MPPRPGRPSRTSKPTVCPRSSAAVPARRIGDVEDVADVIAFLARPESSYLTGATYDVNGGSHIHWRGVGRRRS